MHGSFVTSDPSLQLSSAMSAPRPDESANKSRVCTHLVSLMCTWTKVFMTLAQQLNLCLLLHINTVFCSGFPKSQVLSHSVCYCCCYYSTNNYQSCFVGHPGGCSSGRSFFIRTAAGAAPAWPPCHSHPPTTSAPWPCCCYTGKPHCLVHCCAVVVTRIWKMPGRCHSVAI